MNGNLVGDKKQAAGHIKGIKRKKQRALYMRDKATEHLYFCFSLTKTTEHPKFHEFYNQQRQAIKGMRIFTDLCTSACIEHSKAHGKAKGVWLVNGGSVWKKTCEAGGRAR